MSREWKPGDVALRVSSGGRGLVAHRVARCTASTSMLADGPHWHFISQSTPTPQCGGDGVATYRPLVVIDPEDREQVDRLAVAYWGTDNDRPTRQGVDNLQKVLREFANPKPPKPDEPTGLGAVVEDNEGKRYVRTSDADCRQPWSYANNYTDFDYSQIAVVRVLSEGVTA